MVLYTPRATRNPKGLEDGILGLGIAILGLHCVAHILTGFDEKFTSQLSL